MKKNLIFLTLFISIFCFSNVKAEEVTDSTASSILNYAEINYDLKNYDLFIGSSFSKYTLLLISNLSTSTSIFYSGNFLYFSNSFEPYPRYISCFFDSSANLLSCNEEKSMNSLFNNSFQYFYFSSFDIYDSNKENVYFSKNYTYKSDEVNPEPTPSPSPSPTPSPVVDECSSVVCDITYSILGEEFDYNQYPWVETTLNFLVIMIFIFTLISPFLVIKMMLGAWL